MTALFHCPNCGVDRSHNATGGRRQNPHALDCPRRGAHLIYLTVANFFGNPQGPAIVAQCDDGHEFWEGERRTGENTMQTAGAEADMDQHNFETHAITTVRA